MIESIRLINWRSHSDSLFKFNKGTNLLIGIMGSGKSSVLEAISFALFGTFPALERRKLKLENVLRLNENKAKIVLELVWSGSLYKIEREIERSGKGVSTNAEIFKNNSLIEHGQSAVSTYLQSLFSLDYDLFTRAVYSEQNNIDYFLNLDPRRRKEEVDRLLGLDRFEIARSNIVSVINQTRSKRHDMELRSDNDRVSVLEKKESQLLADTVASKSELDKATAELKDLIASFASVNSEFSELNRKKAVYERLHNTLLPLSIRLEQLRTDLGGKTITNADYERLIATINEKSSERQTVLSGLKSLEERISSASKQLGHIEGRQKSLADSAAKLQSMRSEMGLLLASRTMDQINSLQKDADTEVIRSEAEVKSMERALTEISELMPKLKAGLSQCPLCSSELTEDTIIHIKSEREHTIRSTKDKMAALLGHVSAKRRESDQLLKLCKRVGILHDMCGSLENDLNSGTSLSDQKDKLGDLLSSLLSEKKSHSSTYDQLSLLLEKLNSDLNEVKTTLSKLNEIQNLSKAYDSAHTEITALHFDQASFDSIKLKVETFNLKKEKLQTVVSAHENKIRMHEDLLASVRVELSALRKVSEDIARLVCLEEQLLLYKNALLETQLSLRTNLIEAVNRAMNEVWSIFYPYRNYHGLRIGVTDKDYVFEVDDGSGWKNLEVISSGGERACAALSLRVALAMVLTPTLSWLVLDEPTHNLDKEAVELLSSALQFKVPEVVGQVFVITHDESFIGSDFASSYRLTRDKNRNGETKLEAT